MSLWISCRSSNLGSSPDCLFGYLVGVVESHNTLNDCHNNNSDYHNEHKCNIRDNFHDNDIHNFHNYHNDNIHNFHDNYIHNGHVDYINNLNN